MTTPTKQLKPFPLACTKQELVAMYLDQMKEADILRGINEIIRENRKLSHDRPVYVQRIWAKELKEFVEIFGVANGYYLQNAA